MSFSAGAAGSEYHNTSIIRGKGGALLGLPVHFLVTPHWQQIWVPNYAGRRNGWDIASAKSKTRGGRLMTHLHAFVLGVMATLTPSLLLLAALVWREGIGLNPESDEGAHSPRR